jgi:hypothetical protein
MRHVQVLSAALLALSAASAHAQSVPPAADAPVAPAPESAPPEAVAPAVEPAAPGPEPTAAPAQEPARELVPAPASEAPPALVPPAAAATSNWVLPGKQLKLELDNGTSIRFGALAQVQYEANGDFAGDTSQQLFIRRTMILIGGTVLKDFEYFLDTEFVDLGKAAGDDALKNGPGISLKDIFVTWKAVGDALKIDGGLMLPPLHRNSLQGAPFLYGLDFFANAYTHSALFGTASNSFGRDLGLQARGAVLKGHLEYRAGVFQGRRTPATANHPIASNPFRAAARLQINVLDPELVYFLRGTNLGEKKILSFAASIDVQPNHAGNYVSWSADALLDLPLVTAQLDYVYRDGDKFLPLPKQQALMAEGGVNLTSLKLSPIARFERRWGDATTVDETDVGGGLSYFAFGHNANIKAYYIRGLRDHNAADYHQFNAQWQVFFY